MDMRQRQRSSPGSRLPGGNPSMPAASEFWRTAHRADPEQGREPRLQAVLFGPMHLVVQAEAAEVVEGLDAARTPGQAGREVHCQPSSIQCSGGCAAFTLARSMRSARSDQTKGRWRRCRAV